MRGTRWSRNPQARAGAGPRERGESPIARAFEQGPFAALPVPQPSEDHLALLARLLGHPVTAETVAAYERVRAFVGYTGPSLAPQLAAEQFLAPPAAAPPPAPVTTGRSTSPLAAPASLNPHDLGD